MKIILEQPSYKTIITIEVDGDDLNVDEVVQQLIRPALLGAGFHPDSVNSVIVQ